MPRCHKFPAKDQYGYTDRYGVKFLLNRSDFDQWNIYIGRQSSVDNGLKKIVQKWGKTAPVSFADIGANIGSVSLRMAKYMQQEGYSFRVHSFEPNPFVLPTIKQNIAQNPQLADTITLHEVAMSSEPGEMPFYFTPSHTGKGSLHQIGTSGEAEKTMVKVDTLDTYLLPQLQEQEPQARLVIKIDVEGNELEVLKGAAQLFEQKKPIVIFELFTSHLRRAGITSDDLLGLMESYGYEMTDINNTRLAYKKGHVFPYYFSSDILCYPKGTACPL